LTINPPCLAPLKKGGTGFLSKSPDYPGGDRIPIKVPLLKGDLGGSGLSNKPEIQKRFQAEVDNKLTALALLFVKFFIDSIAQLSFDG